MGETTRELVLCTVPGCTSRYKSRGWCAAHYRRWLIHGDVQPDIPVKTRAPGETRTCKYCGTAFVSSAAHHWYCSGLCLRTARNAATRASPEIKMCRSCCRKLPTLAYRIGRPSCIECEDLRQKELKRCLRCNEVKSRADHFHTRKNQDGHEPQCKACSSKVSKIYNARSDVKRRVKDRHLRQRYGISLEQYEQKLKQQGGLCAICKCEPDPSGRPFHVDHDHRCCSGHTTCGKCVRDLLCRNCNVLLGMINDSVEKAKSVINYLERHLNVQNLGP